MWFLRNFDTFLDECMSTLFEVKQWIKGSLVNFMWEAKYVFVALSAISNSFEIFDVFTTFCSFSSIYEWLINNKSMDPPIDTLTCSYVLNMLETHEWHSQVTDLYAIIYSG